MKRETSIAGRPIGISIIMNDSIGSSLNQRVFAASAQISGMLGSGHKLKRMDMAKTVGRQGTAPLSSPRFILRCDCDSFTPTTMTCSAANRSPIILTLDTSHALEQLPCSVSAKKARCSGGTSPIMAPKTTPMTGALQNWYRKLNVFWYQAGSRENRCSPYSYVLRSAGYPLRTMESGRSEVDSSVRGLSSLLLSLPYSTS